MNETSLSLLDQFRSTTAPSAWRRLTEIYQPLIRSWLGRCGAPTSDIDDLVQEVLVVVMQKLPDYRHNRRTGAFRNWLRQVTVNCLRDFWKSRRGWTPALGGSDFQQVVHDLEDSGSKLARQWDDEHDRHIAANLMRQIKSDFDARTWLAFELLTLRQQSAAEVARQLGLSRGAVYAVKSRVMSRLREQARGILDEAND